MLRIVLPYLPPTTNKAYTTIRGIRVLSSKGREFKRIASVDLLRKGLATTRVRVDVHYGVAMLFSLPNMCCKTWPKKAKNKYQKVDVSNRIKLLEDSLAQASGVDDSQFFPLIASKNQGEATTRIWFWDAVEERNGARTALQEIEELQQD